MGETGKGVTSGEALFATATERYQDWRSPRVSETVIPVAITNTVDGVSFSWH